MGDWPVVFTVPLRYLGALWPRGGCGCLAGVVLSLMILGALY